MSTGCFAIYAFPYIDLLARVHGAKCHLFLFLYQGVCGGWLCLFWKQAETFTRFTSLVGSSRWWRQHILQRYYGEGHNAQVTCFGFIMALFMSYSPQGYAVWAAFGVYLVCSRGTFSGTLHLFQFSGYVWSCGGCATHLWTLSLVVLVTHLQSFTVGHTLYHSTKKDYLVYSRYPTSRYIGTV